MMSLSSFNDKVTRIVNTEDVEDEVYVKSTPRDLRE